MSASLRFLVGDSLVLIDAADASMVLGQNWRIVGQHKKKVYVKQSRRGGQLLHRLLALPEADQVVDHINGDTLDNRRSNLRCCTPKENHRNKNRSRPGFKGVHKRPRCAGYRAIITVDGKQVNLGSYGTEIEAASAYDRAAVKLFGDFANLNLARGRDWIVPYASCLGSEAPGALSRQSAAVERGRP